MKLLFLPHREHSHASPLILGFQVMTVEVAQIMVWLLYRVVQWVCSDVWKCSVRLQSD